MDLREKLLETGSGIGPKPKTHFSHIPSQMMGVYFPSKLFLSLDSNSPVSSSF